MSEAALVGGNVRSGATFGDGGDEGGGGDGGGDPVVGGDGGGGGGDGGETARVAEATLVALGMARHAARRKSGDVENLQISDRG